MKSKNTKPADAAVEEHKKTRRIQAERSALGGRFRLQIILVPVDFSRFSEKALEYALAFAGQFQANIVLLHVVEPAVYPENYVTLPAITDDVQVSLMKAAETKLAEQCQRLAAPQIRLQSMTRLGRPFTEITEAARELEADLIILSTHGYTGLKHVLLGSTAERVVRHAPCPVLTVRDPEHDFIAPDPSKG